MSIESNNRRTSIRLAIVVVGMFGFGYLLIPLYTVFCEITGINGKGIQIANSEDTRERGNTVDLNRTITVEFTGAVMGGLPWEFEPAEKVTIHPGETVQVAFKAHNLSTVDVVGQAVPSISPPRATRHFIKTECFCFTTQTLAGGESRDMPLIFRVDKDLPDSVKTITLSYAFYRSESETASHNSKAVHESNAGNRDSHLTSG